MALLPTEKLKREVEEERQRLHSGQKRPPLLRHKMQRGAARGLCAFFAVVLALTLLSRAADGVTIPRVQAQKTKTGVLTQRFTAAGTLQPQEDLTITLPGGVMVTDIVSEQGARVAAGDTLLALDEAGLNAAIEKLRNTISLLNLQMENAAHGGSGAAAEAVLAAQEKLRAAQEDYDRLALSRGRTEERSAQDEQAAQEEYDRALTDLEKAKEKAKQALIKTAQEKVDAAQQSLETTQETAADAIEAAQQSLTAAIDAQNSYSKGYYTAVEGVNNLRDQLSKAQTELDALIAAGASDEEIQAAQEKVDALAEQMDSAQWGVPNYNYSADLAVQRAKENLAKVKEKQQGKIEKAEKALQTEQEELARAKGKTDLSEEPLVLSAQTALDAAQQTLKNAQRGTEDAAIATDDQLFSAQRNLEDAQRTLESAQRSAAEERRGNTQTARQSEIDRLGFLSQRREAEQTLAALEQAAQAGGRVLAPVAGTVTFLLGDTGKTQDGAKAAVLAREDEGCSFSAQVSEEEAKDLAVGDEGSLTYTSQGRTQELKGVISALSATDSEGKVKVTVELPQGNYPSGVSATFEISKRSQQYDSVLPLGAVRSDGDGSYVLVLREKQTVLGLEQSAVKVSVKVLEQDSETAAVEGSLWDEQVITSASKPVSDGDRVRLETE